MATRISATAQNQMAEVIRTLTAGGTVQVRTGTQPAGVGTAASGTLLATLTLGNPSFGTATNGVITANAVTGDSSADATGTAGWFRAYSSSSAGVIDGSVTASGGGGDMTFDSVSFIAGGAINMTSWTVTHLAG